MKITEEEPLDESDDVDVAQAANELIYEEVEDGSCFDRNFVVLNFAPKWFPLVYFFNLISFNSPFISKWILNLSYERYSKELYLHVGNPVYLCVLHPVYNHNVYNDLQ